MIHSEDEDEDESLNVVVLRWQLNTMLLNLFNQKSIPLKKKWAWLLYQVGGAVILLVVLING